MAFDTTVPRNDYVGTNTLATYSFGFRIFAATDLRVTKVDTAGVETALVYPTDFTIPSDAVNNPSGSTITLVAGNLPTGYGLTIRFDRTPQQSTDLRNQGGFFAEIHEDKFDELTRYVQQLKDLLARSIHVPETEAGTEAATQLSTALVRASKFMAFDGSGNLVLASGTSANLTPVSSFINTLLDDVDAATARATLGALAKSGDNLTGGINNKLTTVASAASPDIFALTVGNTVDYTGTATATGFATSPQAGAQRTLVCAAASVFTAGANMLIDGLVSGQNFTAAAGDKVYVIAVTTTQFRLTVAKKSGQAVGTPIAQFGKAIYGLTYDNGTDAVNDLNINTGGAMDATGAYWMTLATALGKQSDVAWAVGGTTGTPLGGLDTGAVGNSDYYIWLIARSDTGVVDALYSLSSTAPTMPANYDFKRLIGWFKRVGATVVAMKTYETEGGGLELLWSVPTLDVNLANTLTTSRRTDAVKVPLNFSTIANLNVVVNDVTGSGVWICCPDQTDAAPSATVAPLASISMEAAGGSPSANILVRTSATGTIASRSTVATTDLYAVSTMGFTWARRN